VWDAEYPWDVRVEKVAGALTRRGHEVHIVARNRDSRPLHEQLPEGMVHRMPPIKLLGSRANAMTMFPAFFNPRWARLITGTARRINADLILCRDIPLAPTALRTGARLGIPVILDMAENYAAMIAQTWEAGRRKPLDVLVRNPAAVRAVERWVLKRVAHTIVVVEESRDRITRLGVPRDHISVVSNTPSLSRLDDSPGVVPRGGGGELHLFYLGLLEVARGVGVILEAIAICRQAGQLVRFSVYGSGRDAELFKEQADRLGIADQVRFFGFVEYRQALDAMRGADVGVVPHFADESWNTTIPNKLFDYMAAGLPVLTSDALPAARVVRGAECGEVFRDRDARDAAEAIGRMFSVTRRAAAGEAGRRAIRTAYNWEGDSVRLIQAVEQVAAAGPRLRG
jgi:glycosyltransferase involved in cell wall biosynthesis